jgi:3-hydroxymyristoyl/3-hydroxydecanoyl-(acyl carrier protein) dehydratase
MLMDFGIYKGIKNVYMVFNVLQGHFIEKIILPSMFELINDLKTFISLT